MTDGATASPARDPVLLTVGRINYDLYAEPVGASIAQATGYTASVGGSPTNVAIVAAHLGVSAAVFTAVGRDRAGDFLIGQLAGHGVDTRWVGRTERGTTSLALLATVSPDDGELQFFRDNPADRYLDAAAVPGLPWESLGDVLLSADALAGGTTAATVTEVAATASARGVRVWWDLDLRATNWDSLGTYSMAVRRAVPGAAVVIGTELEFAALFGIDPRDTPAVHDAAGRLDAECVIVKAGPDGATAYRAGHEPVVVAARPVEPVCTVGAGDTVSGTLIAARRAGADWRDAMDLAMEAASITVALPRCSDGFPALAVLRGRLDAHAG